MSRRQSEGACVPSLLVGLELLQCSSAVQSWKPYYKCPTGQAELGLRCEQVCISLIISLIQRTRSTYLQELLACLGVD